MTTYQQGIMLSDSIVDMGQQKTSGSASPVEWEKDRAITCDSSPEVVVQARPSVVILFFFSAVGCTMGWTAILSSLVYYSAALGMDSYLFLNLGASCRFAQCHWLKPDGTSTSINDIKAYDHFLFEALLDSP
mmetsp:Transcript_23873/g.43334  ORF Transcript_23873/g.43334 Transcript_23873/m.43334 type:complete len:132 (+) Transcript_23873:39-434(+)